jgi:hypothetical protein
MLLLKFFGKPPVGRPRRKREKTFKLAVPWLRELVAGLSSQRPGFNPGSVYVGFVVEKMALGQVFPLVLRFSPLSFIPPVLHYTGKRKNELSLSQGYTISLNAALRP